MHPRVSIPLLALVICGVFATHIQIEPTENGNLLAIDGRKVDLLGHVNNQWVALTRSCQNVTMLGVDEALLRQAQSTIQNYSPPNSQSAQIASAWSSGAWLLVEVEFDDLLPAVVTLTQANGALSVVPNAIWSGYTQPWVAAPFIRDYLSRQAPEMPSDLVKCFTPRSKSFTQNVLSPG
ncbi:hypothetical protein [Limnohabitans sp.]|jgi:hypothetical protein|uniref:hypothetical protein n=1 Tax=Limnohabitans sp. TaxID=1907725 RepID=UPI002FDC8319